MSIVACDWNLTYLYTLEKESPFLDSRVPPDSTILLANHKWETTSRD
jgi:hypothetical protein